jgi:hypothetical protein
MFASTVPASQQDKPAERNDQPRSLKVNVNYTGKGQVDSSHNIVVFLFASPAFMDSMPVEWKLASSKAQTIEFSGIAQSPVYIVAAYDPAGGYNEVQGPPPAGSSIGILGKTPENPEPVKIEPGQTAQVELTFDDSVRNP